MITGVHALIYAKQVEEVRVFFRDTLGLPSVDAGHGWLIFALPPAELAVHPAEEGSHELYLMCDNLQATMAYLEQRGVTCLSRSASNRGGSSRPFTCPVARSWGYTNPTTHRR